jgi:hypothetical protein
MKKKIYCLLLFMSLISAGVIAQDVQSSTIEWNSISTFSVQTGTYVDEITKVVTTPDQITWYDKDGIAQETLSITGSIGSWSNVNNNGSIFFKVTSGDDLGIVQFSKSSDKMTIRINIVTANDSPTYELTITTLNVQ